MDRNRVEVVRTVLGGEAFTDVAEYVAIQCKVVSSRCGSGLNTMPL